MVFHGGLTTVPSNLSRQALKFRTQQNGGPDHSCVGSPAAAPAGCRLTGDYVERVQHFYPYFAPTSRDFVTTNAGRATALPEPFQRKSEIHLTFNEVL